MIAAQSRDPRPEPTGSITPKAPRFGARAGGRRLGPRDFNSHIWMAAVLMCTAAIASIPIFSRQVGLSFIPQLMAVPAVGMAALACIFSGRIPRIHPAIIAYLLLIGFWGFTVTDDSLEWANYFTLVKIAGVTLAVHLVFRTPRHLLLLFGVYAMSGIIALALNWSEITELRSAVDAGDATADASRLEGTFANANRAGVFAANVAIFSLIVFFNTRRFIRWVVLVCGVGAALIIGGLTGSRTGMIGLFLAGVSVPIMATAGKRDDLLNRATKTMLLVGLGVGIVLVTLIQLPQFERLTRITQGANADQSSAIRWSMAKECVRIWWTNPIFGVGFQGFQQVSAFGTYSHTTYGEVLANGGIIGISLIGVFFLLPAIQAMRVLRTTKTPELRRLIVGVIMYWLFFFLSSLVSVTYSSRDLIPVFAAICGVLQGSILWPAPRGPARVLVAPTRKPGLQGSGEPPRDSSAGLSSLIHPRGRGR
jgi:O-antigen ligase